MRLLARQITNEEEEESVFISMTDMTVGFLFIVLILLAFFASQFKEQDVVNRSEYELVKTLLDSEKSERIRLETMVSDLEAQIQDLRKRLTNLQTENEQLSNQVKKLETELERVRAQLTSAENERDFLKEENARLKEKIEVLRSRVQELERRIVELESIDPLEAYLSAVARERNEIVREIRDAIIKDFPELDGIVTAESDALRFQGQGLFSSGQNQLRAPMIPVIHRIADKLHQILPCYTLGQTADHDLDCNPSFAVIEAIQIEGHTDDVGGLLYNLNLSAARATSTFSTMIAKEERLRAHLNLDEQPVLSVAGYGPDRPVATNETPSGRAENRRIDLRFIMVTPRKNSEIERIREALNGPEGDGN